MSELKKCPFCGGIPAVVEDGYKAIAVHCFNCGADITAESEKKARAAWNRRTGKDINVPTNADRIRSMSDEELARELLAMYLHGHCDCNEENGICITEQSLLDWLKQPAKEELT